MREVVHSPRGESASRLGFPALLLPRRLARRTKKPRLATGLKSLHADLVIYRRRRICTNPTAAAKPMTPGAGTITTLSMTARNVV